MKNSLMPSDGHRRLERVDQHLAGEGQRRGGGQQDAERARQLHSAISSGPCAAVGDSGRAQEEPGLRRVGDQQQDRHADGERLHPEELPDLPVRSPRLRRSGTRMSPAPPARWSPG